MTEPAGISSDAIFGLIGVGVGAAITLATDFWTKRKDQERSAQYLAIRVVCVLDEFVDRCSEVVGDDGLYHGQTNQNEEREARVSAPDAPSLPSDVDWKSVDPDLAYRLLSLPNIHRVADEIIAAASDQAFPPDYEEYFEERRIQYASLGLRAAALADELRKTYEIMPRPVTTWDTVGAMRKTQSAIEAERKERERVAAARMAKSNG